jgi:solute carrier family 25 citrate transporter 1
MSAKSVRGEGGKKPASAAVNLIAGGGAGMMEALACHWLDTIKVRMQLSRRGRQPGTKARGFVATGINIVKRETVFGLYKGLGAVLTGIVPKMAIRFTSYEWYKQLLANKDGVVTSQATFLGTLPYPARDRLDFFFCSFLLIYDSWLVRGCDRGCCSRTAHGGYKNKITSSISQSL